MKKRKKKKKSVSAFFLVPVIFCAFSAILVNRICTRTAAVKLDPILSSAPPSSSSQTSVMESNGPASIKLIDISHHDTVTDWKAVKSSVEGAYIKATEGVTYTDPLFDTYAPAALANGLSVGFYHFFWPCGNPANAKDQADHFYQTIKKYKYSLVPVLDVEEKNGQTPAAICGDVAAFAQEFKKLSGKDIMIYCSPSFANSYLTDKALAAYPLWIAHYDVNTPRNTLIWHNYDIWQYGETITVPGINEKVDGDLATANVYLNPSEAPAQQGAAPSAL